MQWPSGRIRRGWEARWHQPNDLHNERTPPLFLPPVFFFFSPSLSFFPPMPPSSHLFPRPREGSVKGLVPD